MLESDETSELTEGEPVAMIGDEEKAKQVKAVISTPDLTRSIDESTN